MKTLPGCSVRFSFPLDAMGSHCESSDKGQMQPGERFKRIALTAL